MVEIILSILVLLGIIGTVLYLRSYKNLVRKEFKPNEKISGDINNDKKALILYVPSKHNSVNEIKDVIENKLIKNGYCVYSNFPNVDFPYDINKFDVLCYMSPVYFKKVSYPLCEVLVNSGYENKKVLIISVGNKDAELDELEYMKGLIHKNNKVHTLKTNKMQKKRIESFIDYSTI